jgi:hypothetical protein
MRMFDSNHTRSAAQAPREVSGGVPLKINTRIGHLPDVTDVDHPLVAGSTRLIDQLRQRRLTVDDFLTAIGTLHRDLDVVGSLTPWIERALTEHKNQILYRITAKDTRETIQLYYLEPYEVHPPHCHHNVISTQVVLRGRLRVREYDRIARCGPDTILLRLRADTRLNPGDSLRTCEVERNAHWFAAPSAPAVVLNFNVYGFQDWTFDPKDRPLQRRLIDPTLVASPDGLIVARELALEDGYRKFANRSLDSFAIPRPPAVASSLATASTTPVARLE